MKGHNDSKIDLCDAAADHLQLLKPAPQKIDLQKLSAENVMHFYKIGDALYSGNAPNSAAFFQELKKAGIRSLISVDGATPRLPEAKAVGMQYRHVPIAYSTITEAEQAKILAAYDELPKPVYIHCHHGKHRGPAAAMIIARQVLYWNSAQAEQAMKKIGTSSHYKGLYKSVGKYKRLSKSKIKAAGPIPEKAAVDDFTSSMAVMDRRWDRIKLLKKHGWKIPPRHPDIDPPHEVLMMRELFRELARQNEHPEFHKQLKASEAFLAELENMVRQGKTAAADATFKKIGNSCRDCHYKHRD